MLDIFYMKFESKFSKHRMLYSGLKYLLLVFVFLFFSNATYSTYKDYSYFNSISIDEISRVEIIKEGCEDKFSSCAYLINERDSLDVFLQAVQGLDYSTSKDRNYLGYKWYVDLYNNDTLVYSLFLDTNKGSCKVYNQALGSSFCFESSSMYNFLKKRFRVSLYEEE